MRLPFLVLAAVPLLAAAGPSPLNDVYNFKNPVDALSIRVYSQTEELSVRYQNDGMWSEWRDLAVNTEQDPGSYESEMLMLPRGVRKIQVVSNGSVTLHPIYVSDEPVRTYVAAASGTMGTRVLTRAEWGADESLTITGAPQGDSSPAEDPENSNGGGGDAPVSQRVKECNEAQSLYPGEFKISKTVHTDADGNYLRWPLQYSQRVKLLVVHHTAGAVGNDARSGVERMRAIYAYHAQSRGWGDIGYNYVIDENGQIYEGKKGGKGVVAGHAYCNNVGSIGISLMGNFEVEQPTQSQMRSLQWLLANLADTYNIDVSKSVKWHGKTMDPIVGHKDLLSTECPGYYAYNALSQVRSHVRSGNVTAPITFPKKSGTISRSSTSKSSRTPTVPLPSTSGLQAIGSTTIEGRPGGDVTLTIGYKAGSTTVSARSRLGTVKRSNDRIGIWQPLDGRDTRVRNELLLPQFLRAGESIVMRLRVQLPVEDGSYTVTIGDVKYSIKATGRRARAPVLSSSRTTSAPPRTGVSRSSLMGTRTSSSSSSVRSTSSRSSRTPVRTDNTIRVRLSYTGTEAMVLVPSGTTVKGFSTDGVVHLSRSGEKCQAFSNGTMIGSTDGIIRIEQKGIFTVSSWNTTYNKFRGTLECRILDDTLVLINELPIEQYMAGLAEEPDTEPYEKQRAFAIAARSYAVHYLDSKNRKFPGMPYDGNDSPATFQKYSGAAFETQHPRWVQAVQSTSQLVLLKNNQVVKAPYFSSDNGRTKSPEEAGWKNFPFAEVFSSKADPWCKGMENRGHGVGMSGCGAEGQANEGRTGEQILEYYYPGTDIRKP